MRRPLLFLLLLLALPALPAQTATATTLLHHDRPYHAAGEVSWFRAYLPLPAPRIVRAEVFAPDGGRLDQFFLRADPAGTADGYYRWGYDLPTGYYRIVLTALSTAGEAVALGTFRHAVYSPDDRDAPATGAVAPSEESFPSDDLTLRVVDGEVRLTNAPAGSYSLSVFNTEVTGDRPAATLSAAAVAPPASYRDTLFYRGRVAAREGGEATTVNLLPVFDGTTFATYFSKSDGAGDFLLTVPPFEGEKVVQARNVTGPAVVARLDAGRLPRLAERPPLTEAVRAYLDLSNRRRKIFQLYRTVETPLDVAPAPGARRALAASKAYDVQDYKTFPDMYTFFREVAGELRYRERKGSYTARLYNAPTQRFFTETPLFIVDGRLTRDADYVARLRPADVDRVAFYYGNRKLRELFPALGSQGVVQIDRLQPADDLPAEDAANLLTLDGLQPPLSFPPRTDGPPRISPLLLWATGTTAGGTLSLPLPGTDDAGTYRVVMLLRDAAGRQLRGTTTFTLEASR